MRFLAPGATSVDGCGWSRAAKARRAGCVTFSMPPPSAIRVAVQRTSVTFSGWPLPDSGKAVDTVWLPGCQVPDGRRRRMDDSYGAAGA